MNTVTSRTAENVDLCGDLVLSQDGTPHRLIGYVNFQGILQFNGRLLVVSYIKISV